MMTMVNNAHIQGYLYDASKLKDNVAGPNTKTPGVHFISGSIRVATDEKMTNIVDVRVPYTSASFTSKKDGQTYQNKLYQELFKIITGEIPAHVNPKTPGAGIVRIDGPLKTNDFISTQDGELKSPLMIELKFFHVDTEFKGAASFKVDSLITKASHREAVLNEDGTEKFPEKVVLDCFVFGTRKDVKEYFPISLSVLRADAMSFFDGLGVSAENPFFTQLEGQIITQTGTRKIEKTSAWGSIEVSEVPVNRREYEVEFARQEAYEFGSDSTITAADLQEMSQRRELELSKVRDRAASRTTSTSPFANPAPAAPVKTATGAMLF